MKTQIFSKAFVRVFLGCIVVLFTAQVQAGTVQLKGSVQGFQTKDNDDVVDGALVLPSVKAESILRFDIENLMAPNEAMSAGPETIQVPGNLFFPKQKESYLIFSIVLNKDTFSFYPVVGEKDELSALWFKAPFKELIKMGKDKAPFTEMLPLIRMHKYGFEAERDWASERTATLKVNQDFQRKLNYNWTRGAGAAGTTDLMISFQRTPTGRWLLIDLQGKPKAQGTIASAASLQTQEMKTLFIRVQNGADRKPVSATALIRASVTDGTVQAGELPAGIENAAVQTRSDLTTVSWKSLAAPGWMAVLRTTPAGVIENEFQKLLDGEAHSLSCDLARAINGVFRWETQACDSNSWQNTGDFTTSRTTLEGWAPAQDGKFALKTKLDAKDKITLLFIGTDRVTPAPDADPSRPDPELFTYATELRMVRIP